MSGGIRPPKRLLQLWMVGLASSLLVSGASALGYLEPLQARALDALLLLQGRRFAPEVVIVAIDDRAFEALGRTQPISREYLARLIRALHRSGAGVVGLDIELASPTTAASDAALTSAILDFSRDGVSQVVLPTVPFGAIGLNDPRLERSVVRGDVGMPIEDGSIRNVALVVAQKDTAVPAWGLSVAARLGGVGPEMLDASVRAPDGRVIVPEWRFDAGWAFDPQGAIVTRPSELTRINFVGPAGSFLTIPSDAVVGIAHPGADIAVDNPFRGRVVLVGGTFSGTHDYFSTPYGPMAGVEIHANVVHMLVTRAFIRPSDWLTSLGVQVAVILVAGVIFLVLRPLAGTLVCLLAALALGIPASFFAFHRGGFWVDFVLPVAAVCVMGAGTDIVARHRLRSAFGRYVSREVLAQVIIDAPALRGGQREVSVLFSDLRDFTKLSETMAPDAVARHLNEYFEAMTGAIFANGGMVNDFIGDAMMAIFGAPIADPEHALHAVRSAVAMDRALADLNRHWSGSGSPVLRMGIGVHSGEVFAGNVGSEDRMKYTVIGDVVNAASRLEGLNKELASAILITEETRRRLGDRVELKDRGELHVKGRQQPLHVFEVMEVR